MMPVLDLFGLKIFSYPLLMGVAWGLGIQIAKSLNSRFGVKFKYLNIYLMGVFLSSWLGAKLLYLLSADNVKIGHLASEESFWLGGGFVFYGGLLAGLGFTLYFGIKTSQTVKFFNIFIPGLCFGHALGRVGCFLAGCCYGIPHQSLISIHLHEVQRFPVQLLEAFFLVIFGIYSMREKSIRHKNLAFMYLSFYAFCRFVFEFARGDSIRGVWFDLISTSQIISLIISVVVLMTWRLSQSRPTSSLDKLY